MTASGPVVVEWGRKRRLDMVKMEAYNDGEMWCARGIGVDIFTQGRTLDELLENIKEAVALHFEESGERPEILVLSEIRADDAKAAAG